MTVCLVFLCVRETVATLLCLLVFPRRERPSLVLRRADEARAGCGGGRRLLCHDADGTVVYQRMPRLPALFSNVSPRPPPPPPFQRDYVHKEVFNKNFFHDWRETMTPEERRKITDLKKCDFTKIKVSRARGRRLRHGAWSRRGILPACRSCSPFFPRRFTMRGRNAGETPPKKKRRSSRQKRQS